MAVITIAAAACCVLVVLWLMMATAPGGAAAAADGSDGGKLRFPTALLACWPGWPLALQDLPAAGHLGDTGAVTL